MIHIYVALHLQLPCHHLTTICPIRKIYLDLGFMISDYIFLLLAQFQIQQKNYQFFKKSFVLLKIINKYNNENVNVCDVFPFHVCYALYCETVYVLLVKNFVSPNSTRFFVPYKVSVFGLC